MCRAIQSHLGSIPLPPPGNEPLYSYSVPDGGMFVFLKFPYHYLPLTSEELFRQLASVGVIIVPGDDFYVPSIMEELNTSTTTNRSKEVTLRLTYAAAQPEAIDEGIGRLSNGIQNILKSLSNRVI